MLSHYYDVYEMDKPGMYEERESDRPRANVDACHIVRLRASGLSWPKIARELGISVGTAYSVAQSLSKRPSEPAAATR